MKHGAFNVIPKGKDKFGNGKQPIFPLCKEGHVFETTKMKKLFITFFHIKATVHLEFIPQGQTVNQAYYLEILKRLLEVVHRKRPELWPNDWILRHDSAATHRTLSAKQTVSGPEMDY
jgi:hypothetical protein